MTHSHPTTPPRIVVLAGPNGAGKSTSAQKLLRGALGVEEFVNADVIAQGLSGFSPERVAMAAGRIMRRRLGELATSRASFAFETTLASRSFAPWLAQLHADGYHVHLIFLWLPSADVAIERVADRVRRGGHDVPTATIRRRYQRGLLKFFQLYRPVANSWQFVDNSHSQHVRVIATGKADRTEVVREADLWKQVLNTAGVSA